MSNPWRWLHVAFQCCAIPLAQVRSREVHASIKALQSFVWIGLSMQRIVRQHVFAERRVEMGRGGLHRLFGEFRRRWVGVGIKNRLCRLAVARPEAAAAAFVRI